MKNKATHNAKCIFLLSKNNYVSSIKGGNDPRGFFSNLVELWEEERAGLNVGLGSGYKTSKASLRLERLRNKMDCLEEGERRGVPGME